MAEGYQSQILKSGCNFHEGKEKRGKAEVGRDEEKATRFGHAYMITRLRKLHNPRTMPLTHLHTGKGEPPFFLLSKWTPG
jgi:hypothetical protein